MSDVEVPAKAEPQPQGATVDTSLGTETTGDEATVQASSGLEKANNNDEPSNADVRSDSEAETVVLPGKKDAGSTSPHHKAIKHEGNDAASATSEIDDTGQLSKETKGQITTSSPGGEKLSKEPTATSSNLSSARSSLDRERVPSRAISESAKIKPKLRRNSDALSRESSSRKRKNQSEDNEEKGHKRRQARDGSLEGTTNTGPRDRRDKHEGSKARSESPQLRTRNRALSTKPSSVSKRRKPPPLQVNSRGQASADADSASEESDIPTGNSKLRKPNSTDNNATSPVKTVPHKKNRDKSGRTFLARACDGEDVETVRQLIQERPDDLNIGDYAGNTPLQIASLKGSADIVKSLLNAGCDIHCHNVDDDTPLIDAVENSHLEVIKLLLKAGLDPSQSNKHGEVLLDLVNEDDEDADEIKETLTRAKTQRRRPSEDHRGTASAGRASVPARSPRESAHLSPPPVISGSRRRVGRREATRNDLLYMNPTPENLREKARDGDNEAVSHILNMRPVADLPAVIAAARGGHETCLTILVAMGKPEEDPDPYPGYSSGSSTPMLAAIGRGNLRIIEMLLEQSGFDPTRRLYDGMAYHEIAKQRKGNHWEEEVKILKRAYEKRKGKSSNGTSPSNNKGSSNRDLKKSKSEGNASSQSSAKRLSTDLNKDASIRKKGSPDIKIGHGRRDRGRNSPEKSEISRKHLRVPSKTASREQSITLSDRELSPFGTSKEGKHKRSSSDAEAADMEAPKPRKRLISRKALEDDDKRRRQSLASVTSSTSSQEPIKRRESMSGPVKKIKREESRESSKMSSVEFAKKRRRPSPSPSEGNSPKLRKSPEVKKTKRLHVDLEGKSKRKSEGNDSLKHDSPAPQTASTARSSNTGSSAPPKSAAPVAFMGGTATSQSKEAKSTEASSRKGSPRPDSRKITSPKSSPKVKTSAKDDSKSVQDESKDQSEMAKQLHDEIQAAAEQAELQRKSKELAEQQDKEMKKLAREKAERAEEAARKEEQRLADEAERKAKLELEEEEARQEKKRQEEEQARKIAEQKRIAKEEEERIIRRRAEHEERERLARIRKCEEDERRQREALPNALKILAEMSSEQAKQESEVKHWLPLYTAKGYQLDRGCDQQAADELWVVNLQVAPILGVTDLDLSQYTAWTKRAATHQERFSLWRVLRRRLARYEPPPYGAVDHGLEFRMDIEAREKFDALSSIFWIRLSDLQDIIPRHPHLSGVDLKFTAIGIDPVERSFQRTIPNGQHPHLMNGNSNSGTLTNGYH